MSLTVLLPSTCVNWFQSCRVLRSASVAPDTCVVAPPPLPGMY